MDTMRGCDSYRMWAGVALNKYGLMTDNPLREPVILGGVSCIVDACESVASKVVRRRVIDQDASDIVVHNRGVSGNCVEGQGILVERGIVDSELNFT